MPLPAGRSGADLVVENPAGYFQGGVVAPGSVVRALDAASREALSQPPTHFCDGARGAEKVQEIRHAPDDERALPGQVQADAVDAVLVVVVQPCDELISQLAA